MYVRLGLTPKEFALRVNVSLETIRNWEQGRRHPTGAAKALLKVLDQFPNEALEALGRGKNQTACRLGNSDQATNKAGFMCQAAHRRDFTQL